MIFVYRELTEDIIWIDIFEITNIYVELFEDAFHLMFASEF
jgi:hypothetical protein